MGCVKKENRREREGIRWKGQYIVLKGQEKSQEQKIGFLNDNKKGGKKRGSWASSQGHGSLVSSWAALGCLRCILLLTTSHGSNPPPLDYYSHIISLSFKFFFFPSLVIDGCPGFSRGLGHVWILRQRNSFYSAFDCSALELLIRNENRNK
ncbi:unnamed protein product, partial [Vitis vinifera]|uniref:Uncharacterized protein n=1 Tax=Vitis vinifera TaxID=29760 RepID=D7SU18_VITVI